MTTLNLTNKEAQLATNILKPFQPLIKSNPILEVEFLEKVVVQRLDGISSTDGRAILEAILCKIAMSKIDVEIEKMLTQSSYGQTKNTSMKKSKINSSRGHQLILTCLTNASEPLSRSELASLTGLRMASVCGRCKELLVENKIKVAGTKFDEQSQRDVQTLEVV